MSFSTQYAESGSSRVKAERQLTPHLGDISNIFQITLIGMVQIIISGFFEIILGGSFHWNTQEATEHSKTDC